MRLSAQEYSTAVSLLFISVQSGSMCHCCLPLIHSCILKNKTNKKKFLIACKAALSRYSRPKDFLEVKYFLDIIDTLFPRSIAGLAVFFRHFAPGRKKMRRRWRISRLTQPEKRRRNKEK